MKVIKDKISWVDIQSPTKRDIEFLKTVHDFHPIILDELLHLSARSRMEKYDDYLFLTYHLPMYDPKIKTSRRTEIDFLITKKDVITVHYEDLEPIDSFTRSILNNANLKNLTMSKEDTSRLLYYLLEEVIQFSMRQLRHIEENVGLIGQELFKGKEAALLQRISYIKRDILDYRTISHPQGILLNSVMEIGVQFWGQGAKIYLSDLVGDHLKVMQHIENYREAIEAFEATNAQLLNAKTNSVMQRFTVLAFLTFPLVLFTSIFNIESVSAQLDRGPYSFWIGFGVVLLATVIVLLIFRKKGWL